MVQEYQDHRGLGLLVLTTSTYVNGTMVPESQRFRVTRGLELLVLATSTYVNGTRVYSVSGVRPKYLGINHTPVGMTIIGPY
jgi:hypothetical protein